MCITFQDRSVCLSCSQGYQLTTDEICVKTSTLPGFVIPLTALLVIVLLMALVVLVVVLLFKKLRPVEYSVFRRMFKRSIRNVVISLGLIIMAQLVSVATAFQDMFNDSFEGFMLCLFAASIPFVLVFSFFDKPHHKRFALQKSVDLVSFLVFVSMDVLFQVNLYFLMPQPLQSTEQMFKAISAPLALVIFILFLHFKFERF